MITIWEQEYDMAWIIATISDDRFDDYIKKHAERLLEENPRMVILETIINSDSVDFFVENISAYPNTSTYKDWKGFNYTKKELNDF